MAANTRVGKVGRSQFREFPWDSGNILGSFDEYNPVEELPNGAYIGQTVDVDSPSGFGIKVLKNGSTALNTEYTLVESVVTTLVDENIAAAVRAGNRVVPFATTSAITAKQFSGGSLVVYGGTGATQHYAIASHTIKASGAGSINITLDEDLREALDTTSDVYIVSAEGANVQEGTASGNPAQGFNVTTIPADYYFCAQVRGRLPAIPAGDITVGQNGRKLTKAAAGKVGLADNVGQQVIGEIIETDNVVEATRASVLIRALL